jgi:hypothetical protein
MDEGDMDEREDIEHLLRRGLKPRQTAAGFSARVMARLPETPDFAEKQQTFWLAAMRWAAAAVLLGVAGGSYWEQQQKERMAGEHAREQLMLALRMSAATLNDVQHKVVRDTKGEPE